MLLTTSEKIEYIRLSMQIIHTLSDEGYLPTVILSINPTNHAEIHMSNFPGVTDVATIKTVVRNAFFGMTVNPNHDVKETHLPDVESN